MELANIEIQCYNRLCNKTNIFRNVQSQISSVESYMDSKMLQPNKLIQNVHIYKVVRLSF